MRNFRLFSLKEIYRQKEEGGETGIMRPQMFLLKISVKQSVSRLSNRQASVHINHISNWWERCIPNEGFFFFFAFLFLCNIVSIKYYSTCTQVQYYNLKILIELKWMIFWKFYKWISIFNYIARTKTAIWRLLVYVLLFTYIPTRR